METVNLFLDRRWRCSWCWLSAASSASRSKARWAASTANGAAPIGAAGMRARAPCNDFTRPKRGKDAAADMAADQLKRVMKAAFRPRALLNKSEAQVFKALDRIVIARNPRWQVMAQVCLGEFLPAAMPTPPPASTASGSISR